jgi:hypothetical protein
LAAELSRKGGLYCHLGDKGLGETDSLAERGHFELASDFDDLFEPDP